LHEISKECDTCAVLSKAYGGETMKILTVFEWYKWFKESLHMKITNEDNAHHFLWYQGFCSFWIHFTRPVNQAYYVEILKWLFEAIHRDAWTLAQQLDSALWQCSPCLAQKSITEMEHPPYSHVLAPNDFWLFQKIKSALKEWRFQDIGDIQENVVVVKAIP